MICITDCTKAKCLVQPVYCEDSPVVNNLIIGTVTPATDYTLYFHDQNSGVLKAVELTSDVGGLLTFDMNDYPRYFHKNTNYKFWVTLRDAGLTEVENININAENYTCLLLEFEKATESSAVLYGLPNQTVAV